MKSVAGWTESVLLCCDGEQYSKKTMKTTVVEYRYSNSAEHGIVFVLLLLMLLATAIGNRHEIYEMKKIT